MFNLFGGPFQNAINNLSKDPAYDWLEPIVRVLDDLIVPITIVVAVAGAIWIIILGVRLARAETSDKAKEAKGALIRVAVAIVASLVLLWLLVWLASSLPALLNRQPFSAVTSAA